MFGVGLGEILVILLVALVVGGPDKLPGIAKQAAQFVKTLRRMSDTARDDLRRELGPEYADLELRDLDPRTMVRKHLTEAWESDQDEGTVRSAIRPGSLLRAGEVPPFDLEAT